MKVLYFMLKPITMILVYIVIFLVFSFTWFGHIDIVPATESDYNKLIVQKDIIVDDFNEVYKFENSKVNFDGKYIRVTLSNKECNLILDFDKNLNLVEYKEQDKAASLPSAILYSVLFGFVMLCFFIALYLMICFTILRSMEKKEKLKAN